MEIVLAHELMHQLGAYYHDNDPKWNGKCIHSLLNSYPLNTPVNYLISNCTLEQVSSNLFQNKKLKSVFNCLITENNKNKYKKLKKHLEIVRKESIGYFYSLSDQCRLISKNESFVCSFELNNCRMGGLKCFQSYSNCFETRPLDGSVCGKNKICHFAECIDDFNSIKVNKNKYLQKSAIFLRETCPQGSKQKSSVNCEDLINKPNSTFNCNSKLNNLINYNDVCCESCKKAENKKLTCEKLKKNPCFNGGKCVTNKKAVLNNHSKILFNCECPKGYFGDLCLNFKPCYFDPCQENEACHEYGELGHYYCLNEKMNYTFELNLKDVYFVIYTDKKFKYFLRYYLNIIVILIFFFSIIIFFITNLKLLLL